MIFKSTENTGTAAILDGYFEDDKSTIAWRII